MLFTMTVESVTIHNNGVEYFDNFIAVAQVWLEAENTDVISDGISDGKIKLKKFKRAGSSF